MSDELSVFQLFSFESYSTEVKDFLYKVLTVHSHILGSQFCFEHQPGVFHPKLNMGNNFRKTLEFKFSYILLNLN